MTIDPHQDSAQVGTWPAVTWRDLCPWQLLFRVPAVACSASVIVLAVGGCWAALTLWTVLGAVILPENVANRHVQQLSQHTTAIRPAGLQNQSLDGRVSITFDQTVFFGDRNPILYAGARIMEPFALLIREGAQLEWRCVLYCLLGGLINIAIWAYFGTAICRVAVAELGCEQRVGLFQSLRFSGARFGESFLAPLLPLFGMLLFAVPLMILGWFMRFDIGVLIAGLLWVFCLGAAIAMGILAIGLLIGWPFVWAAIAAEGKDVFDAVSRSYSYSYQRPLRYGFYFTVVLLLGGGTWWIVLSCLDIVVTLASHAVSWGSGTRRMDLILDVAQGVNASLESPYALRVGSVLMSQATWLLESCAYSFAYGLFWCSMASIYLLLRRDIDQKEVDEIYWDDQLMVPPWEHPEYVPAMVPPNEPLSPNSPAESETSPTE
ncbi:MAG: hypothetical protein O2931_10010 [Planctomycetota bacterium]|nr:hypothetical protein [Planctomycetota bacterium]MDA1179115.1 hypothetical protein [Planctomycetota bacterium]